VDERKNDRDIVFHARSDVYVGHWESGG
jgi:hypothetical protein